MVVNFHLCISVRFQKNSQELIKQKTWVQKRTKLYHYRTQIGQEIDFMLEALLPLRSKPQKLWILSFLHTLKVFRKKFLPRGSFFIWGKIFYNMDQSCGHYPYQHCGRNFDVVFDNRILRIKRALLSFKTRDIIAKNKCDFEIKRSDSCFNL